MIITLIVYWLLSNINQCNEVVRLLDYVIFFGLMFCAFIVFVLHLLWPKQDRFKRDQQYIKCESPIERKLYQALVFNGYAPQTQTPCGRYRIDITLPAQRIAIECDGKAYHSSTAQRAHDRKKDKYLKDNGWRVLRFSGTTFWRNIGGVIRHIEKCSDRSL